MIDDKLIQSALEGIKHLQDGLEKILESNKPVQPEPQAGDVWETNGGNYVLVCEDGKKLEYRFYDGGQRCHPSNLPTRIFSLSEHLKNKEASE